MPLKGGEDDLTSRGADPGPRRVRVQAPAFADAPAALSPALLGGPQHASRRFGPERREARRLGRIQLRRVRRALEVEAGVAYHALIVATEPRSATTPGRASWAAARLTGSGLEVIVTALGSAGHPLSIRGDAAGLHNVTIFAKFRAPRWLPTVSIRTASRMAMP